MTDHLDEAFTVDQLAARALHVAAHLRPAVRQETGTTPQRWLTGQRILLAQQLLEETDETVDAVAEQVRLRQRAGAAPPLPDLALDDAAGLPANLP